MPRAIPVKPLLAALALVAFALFGPAEAAKPEIYTSSFSSLAVGGYDPVAYFTDGKPLEGRKEFTTTWKGAEWRFASAENLAKFTADPEAFAPRYGGYCAWAMAMGKFAKGDPAIWRIVEGKLYLNYSKSVQETWETDIPGFIAKADAVWPAILER